MRWVACSTRASAIQSPRAMSLLVDTGQVERHALAGRALLGRTVLHMQAAHAHGTWGRPAVAEPAPKCATVSPSTARTVPVTTVPWPAGEDAVDGEAEQAVPAGGRAGGGRWRGVGAQCE